MDARAGELLAEAHEASNGKPEPARQDDRAPSWPSRHDAGTGQVEDRLANGRPADAEAAGQLDLGRQLGAGREDAPLYLIEQTALDLEVHGRPGHLTDPSRSLPIPVV